MSKAKGNSNDSESSLKSATLAHVDSIKGQDTKDSGNGHNTVGVVKFEAYISKNYYDDTVFDAIDENKKLDNLSYVLFYLMAALFLFGVLFLIIGIVSLVGTTTTKAYSWLAGLIAIIHVVAAPIGLVSMRRRNRYLLFAFAIANAAWILLTLVNILTWSFGGKLDTHSHNLTNLISFQLITITNQQLTSEVIIFSSSYPFCIH